MNVRGLRTLSLAHRIHGSLLLTPSPAPLIISCLLRIKNRTAGHTGPTLAVWQTFEYTRQFTLPHLHGQEDFFVPSARRFEQYSCPECNANLRPEIITHGLVDSFQQEECFPSATGTQWMLSVPANCLRMEGGNLPITQITCPTAHCNYTLYNSLLMAIQALDRPSPFP